jgi:hypothetical protein
MAESKLCKFGLHQFVDFPDPNPETFGTGLAQGYRACTRCPKIKEASVYERRTALTGALPSRPATVSGAAFTYPFRRRRPGRFR